VIIPEEISFQSYTYKSKRDFVTNLDIAGMIRYHDQLTVLEPHPDAETWDHSFLSPTFEEPLRRQIKNYIKKYGGKNEVNF